MDRKIIAVIGAGPGLGRHIGMEFGAKGFRSILMARRENALKEYVKEYAEKGIPAEYRCVDCADNDSIRDALSEIVKKYGGVDVLVYNTAVLRGGSIKELDPGELVRRYQVDVAGALCAVRQIVPSMRNRGGGTILFTGGGFALNPSPEYISVSVHKAALRVLAAALNKGLAEDNIFVGIVNIKGNIGSDEYYSPEKIAKQFYELYEIRKPFEITY